MHQIERHHKTRQCQYSSTTYPLSKSDLPTISANPMSETLNAHNTCEVSMQEKTWAISLTLFCRARAVIETGVITQDILFSDSRDKKATTTKNYI